MRVVIVGMGKVGFTLAQELSFEGHDIVAIDKNPKVFEQLQELLDIKAVLGNGASYEIQQEARIANTDLLIAVTSLDEVNLLCCLLAKKMGCNHTIARVRNPDYARQVQYMSKEFGLSMVINPEQSEAQEIFRILQFPSSLQRETFARGRIELIELKIDDDCNLANIRIDQLSQVAKVNSLICTIERGEDLFIPGGNFMLKRGDKITITADSLDLAKLISNLGILDHPITSVMIIGGSHIARYLAAELVRSRIGVKIIEKDLRVCQELAEEVPRALIIHGDGTDLSLLRAEGLRHTDALITLTGIDEENMIISMYAEYVGVPKCVTKVNRLEYASFFKEKGISSVISPKLLASHEILCFVRAMSNTTGETMVALHRIVNERAEALEYYITDRTLYLNTPLRDISFKENILLACIYRNNTVIIPKGDDQMQLGDTVVVVTTADNAIVDLNDIFVDETQRPRLFNNGRRGSRKK